MQAIQEISRVGEASAKLIPAGPARLRIVPYFEHNRLFAGREKRLHDQVSCLVSSISVIPDNPHPNDFIDFLYETI